MSVCSRRFAALLIATLLLPAGLFAADEDKDSDRPKRTKRAEIAVFTIKGALSETPQGEELLPFGPQPGESLLRLVERMDQATEDDDVRAAVVLLNGASVGTAQMDELRQAMERFKAADKPIYAHTESLTTGSYALLSGATRLSVVPTGDLFINGLYGEQLFLRGLFDLVGVTPDFLTCGTHKTAAEQYMRTGPSEASQEMSKWLYDGIYESIIRLIAEGRGVDKQKAEDWINKGLYSAEAAKEQGIIDAVESRAEFEAYIKEQHGDDLKFKKSYGKKKSSMPDFNNPFAAFQLWAEILSGPQTRRSTKDAVAIVYVDGPIMLGEPQASFLGSTSGAYSTPLREALDEVARDDSIKAMVLRVNSPGGSAVASDIILNATKRVREKKPIVVSMGDVAGSGGYYVACGADIIYADEATITGSIGVVAGKLVTTDMWKKIGINWNPIERGENANILSSYSTFNDEEKAQFQTWMDEIYGVFKGHVTDIRGDRLTKPIDDIAGGRVYTGKQGLELGLVDRIGGLDDAIEYIADEAKLEEDGYEIRIVPRPKNFIETLFADMASKEKDDEEHISLGLWDAAGPLLKAADPERLALLKQALRQLDIIHHEGIMLTMPVMDVTP
ncbi:MAG: signal peptide peptidase SppA [Planctomycetaceae bacterium]|nr:signal peptide peptidase SppA [Planctomycetaceae bacterium]